MSHISTHNHSPNSHQTYRQDLWTNGFRPIPVRTKDKAPSGRDWPGDARQDPPPCAALDAKPTPWAQSTGILCDGLRAVDVDIDDPEIVSRIRAELTGAFGAAPMRVRKSSARILVVYRAAEGEPKKRVLKGTAGKVEILGHGQQFVADGIHPDGDRYAWDGPDLLTTPRSSLPAVTEAQIDALFIALAPVIGAAVAEPAPAAKAEPVRVASGVKNSLTPDHAGARERAFAEAALEENARELADCGEGGRNNTLNGIAFRMGRLVGAGWIGPERVEQELFVACQDNGLIRDDGMASVRKTLASGLRAGIADPHEALDPDGEEGDPFNGERLFAGKAAAAAMTEYVDRVTGEILPTPVGGGKAPDPGEPLPLRPAAPPPAPFPLAALGALAPAARAIARKVQVADAIAGQSVLAAAALAVQAHVDVLLPFGQSRPASAFFITIAGSGDRKSSADNEALWPIRQHEKSLREKYADDLKVWKLASAAWSATKRKIETRDKISIAERLDLLVQLGPEPEKPISPVLTTGDVTPDGLTKNWLHMKGALGVFSAEGATFTAGHGMSEDGKLRTAAMLSELWDGKPITRVRAGDGVSQLVGRRLSAHLMVQPDAAGAFLADPVLRDQGFLSRVLVAAPLSIAGSRAYSDPRPEDEAMIRAYGARLLSILETPPPLATDVVNELAPRPVPMSLEAKALWIAFLNEVESRQGPDGDLRPIRDFASKAAEHAARLAVILAALRNLAVSEISADAMACGIALCRFYLSEALRLAGAVKADPRIERALALLTWLQKQNSAEISTSAVMQSGPPVARAKASLDDAIAVLIDHGWVAEVCKRPRRLRLKK